MASGDKLARFDYVVVGGGIIGLSTAFHLLENQAGSILVVDAGPVGSGASGLGTGMVTVQRFEPLDVQLVVRTKEIIKHVGDLTNGLVRVYDTGRLMLVGEVDAAEYRGYIAMQQEAGADAVEVDIDELKSRYRYLYLDDVALAGFSPTDGVVHPPTIVNSLSSLFKQRGGYVWEGVQVGSVEMTGASGGQVVLKSGERIEAGTIIAAAGPWTKELLAASSLPLPLRMVRSESGAGIVADPRTQPVMPAIVDGIVGAIHVPRNPGVYLSSTELGEPVLRSDVPLVDWRAGSARGRTVTDEMRQAVQKAFEHRFRDAVPVRVDRGWAGIFDITPDEAPYLGAYPGVDGLFVACGFSGYGVMRSLASGQALATLMTGQGEGLDISAFAPGRLDLSSDYHGAEATAAHNPLTAFREWNHHID